MAELTITEARAIAVRRLGEMETGVDGLELVVVDAHVVERDWGWVFPYDSRQHLETGETRYALLGNMPIAVERSDGSVHITGPGRSIEEAMERYEQRRARRLAGLPEFPPRSLLWRLVGDLFGWTWLTKVDRDRE